MSQKLNSVFPEATSIPKQVQIPPNLEQREYLVDGQMLTWNGDLSPVASPVCVKEGNEFKQQIIGSTPLLTSKEALDAMEAAVKAYDQGAVCLLF